MERTAFFLRMDKPSVHVLLERKVEGREGQKRGEGGLRLREVACGCRGLCFLMLIFRVSPPHCFLLLKQGCGYKERNQGNEDNEAGRRPASMQKGSMATRCVFHHVAGYACGNHAEGFSCTAACLASFNRAASSFSQSAHDHTAIWS